ncbi:MAG: 2-C-methyl-D-erythritol 4-phosphate cytidylyltransferase [Eubacteriales bacterium]
MDRKKIAVITAAGKGIRLRKDIKKQYIKINEKPIIYHTIKVFNDADFIDAIVIVADRDNLQYVKNEIIDRYNFSKVIDVVEGGITRKDSVRNGFNRIQDKESIIIIHDGVRPFIDEKTILRSIEVAEEKDGAVVAIKSSDTIKIVNNTKVEKTLDRKNLRRIQTPQTFRYEVLERGYSAVKWQDNRITDESYIVESAGFDVYIVEGSETNIKITTEFDLQFAEFLFNRERL